MQNFVILVSEEMSNNGGRPGSPHLISFDDGFEDNFGKDVKHTNDITVRVVVLIVTQASSWYKLQNPQCNVLCVSIQCVVVF